MTLIKYVTLRIHVLSIYKQVGFSVGKLKLKFGSEVLLRMKFPIKNTPPHHIIMSLNSHLTYGPECLTNSADVTPIELAKTKVKKLKHTKPDDLSG